MDRRFGRSAAWLAGALAALAAPTLPAQSGERTPAGTPVPAVAPDGLRPDLFTHRAVAAEVVRDGADRGRTRIDRWARNPAPRNARLLERLDAESFFGALAERIARLP